MYVEAFRQACIPRLLVLRVATTFINKKRSFDGKRAPWILALCATGAMTAAPAALAAPATEGAAGLYIQFDGGLGHLRMINRDLKPDALDQKIRRALKESGVLPRLSGGFDTGYGLRLAFDSAHYANVKGNYRDQNTRLKASARVHSMGAALIFDSVTTTQLAGPYAGLRVSYNTIEYQTDFTVHDERHIATDRVNRLGFGTLMGISWHVSRSLVIDSGVAFNRIDDGFKSREITLGLRYYFF